MKPAPGPDETLLSFLSRASCESLLSWTEFQKQVTGISFRDCRVAERRSFDWDHLAATLGLPRETVTAMSERFFFPVDFSDAKIESLVQAELPWLDSYTVYNPAQLRAGPCFRRQWFLPSSLFDPVTGVLHLQHCHHCSQRLQAAQCGRVFSACPKCGSWFGAAPKVPAPDYVRNFGERLAAALGREEACYEPASAACRDLAVAWRIVPHLDGSMAEEWVDVAQMGPWVQESKEDPVRLALRRVQLLAAGWEIVQRQPELAARIHLAAKKRAPDLGRIVAREIAALGASAHPSGRGS